MIAEKQKDLAPVETASAKQKRRTWLRAVVGLLLGGVGLWFVSREVSLNEIVVHLAAAQGGFILLAVLSILVTTLAKTWRWRLLFFPVSRAPSGRNLFAALTLGQYVNIVLPFVRLGEVARVYALDKETSKARALGTLVVEKALDMVVLALTAMVLLPFVVLPAIISDEGVTLTAVVALAALFFLYLLAYRTEFVIKWLRRLAQQLPLPLEQRLVRLGISGLEGLAALRNRRITAALVASSIFIGIFSIVTPLALFPAFGLALGWKEAALLHLAIMIGSAPPSTPGKIGIFEGITAFMLARFGIVDESLIFGYAVIFHLVVVVPQIALGMWAASFSKWQWPTMGREKERHEAEWQSQYK